MQPEREIDADEAAQEVVNTWGTLALTGNGNGCQDSCTPLCRGAGHSLIVQNDVQQ